MQLLTKETRDKRLGAEIGRLLGGREILDLIENSVNPVTELPGFHMFTKTFLEIRRRTRGQYAVMYFDLDGLKKINDSLGHDRGNMLLVAFKTVLVKFFRRNESDVICHLGGDEFVVFSGRFASTEILLNWAGLARRAFQDLVAILKLEADVSYGVGVGDGRDIGGLLETIKEADKEMYGMKRRHNAEKQASMFENWDRERDLR